jgi:hypothetical protein
MYSSRRRDSHLSEVVMQDIQFYRCVVRTRDDKEPDISFGASGQGV